MLYLDASNATLTKAAIPEQLRHPVRLEAGRAYYLGDFSGTVTLGAWGWLHEMFQVSPVKNEFSATTQDFRQRFPNLRGLTPMEVIRPTEP